MQADAGRGSRADLRRFLGRAGHAQRRDADLFGKILDGLFQLHVQPARTEQARGKIHEDFSVAEIPVVNALAAHVRDGESGLRRQFQRVNAGLLDVQREAVRNHQPRFFEPRADAVGDADDRFDGFEFERERERPGVELIRRQRIARRVDLSQPGQRGGFDQRVLGGNGERTGFALDVQRLRRVQRRIFRSAVNGLFGIQREVAGIFHRLDEFDGQRLAVAVHRRVPVANLFAFQPRERLRRGQRERELRGVALDDFVMKLAGVFDDGRRDLRGDGGIRREQGFVRNLRDLALPAQRDRLIRAEKSRHARDAVGFDGGEQRAVEQLDFRVRARGLRGDGGNRRRRAGERNLVPRFGVLDFGDDLQFEFELSRMRRDEQVAVAFADDFQLVGKFSGQNCHVAFQ